MAIRKPKMPSSAVRAVADAKMEFHEVPSMTAISEGELNTVAGMLLATTIHCQMPKMMANVVIPMHHLKICGIVLRCDVVWCDSLRCGELLRTVLGTQKTYLINAIFIDGMEIHGISKSDSHYKCMN